MNRGHIRSIMCALGFMLLIFGAVLASIAPASAQHTFPEPVPAFYDPQGVFDEAQTNTLARDAELLQSSHIPTFVVVRVVDAEAASPEKAQAAADEIRREWAAQDDVDPDKSLVLLYSHVPDNGNASTIVASWGEHAFDDSGLTPDYIESVLARDPRALLNQGFPFEAVVYAMREIRYGGIYFPPPPAELTGAREILHSALTWISPITALASISVLVMAAIRPVLLSRRIAAISTALAAIVLAILSVVGENRIGIAGTIAVVATLAISGWLWSHTKQSRGTVNWRRVVPDLLLALLFFGVSLGANVDAIPTTSNHPDETRWLNRAYYARELGDPFGPAWQQYVTTRGQPPVGSIVMGIGLAVQGKALDTVNVWDFAYGRQWNEWMGAIPSDEIRTAGRRTNAVIGAMVVAMVYLLGRLLTNRAGGIIGALFLAFHPLHIMLSTQALSDETLALLLMLVYLAGWWFAKKPTWTRAILLGVLLGLGGGVKLTPLLFSGPLAIFGVLRLILDRDRAARDYAIKLILQPAIAFITFVAIYPYLWSAPIRRSWNLYAFRASEMQDQNAAWPEKAVDGPLDALGRFGSYLSDMSLSGRAFGPLANDLGFDQVHGGLDYIPAVVGLVILLWWVAKRGFWTPEAMVALLMGSEAGTLIFGMKTDFYRYHLPIVVIMAVTITITSGLGWSWFVRFVHSIQAMLQRQTPRPQTATFADPLETRQ